MKKIFATVLALCMMVSLAACGDKPAPAPQPEKETYTATLEIESIPADAAMKGHVKCYNSKKELAWEYDTEQVYVGQLDNIQEIGITSYGYLLLVDGDIVCLGLEGENAGKEIWRNDMFGGASASWDFDEDENLYICGYFGPELVVVNPEGETVNFYPPQLVDDCYWPCGLTYDQNDGNVILEYDSFGTKVKMNPKTGDFVEFVIEDKSDYMNLLCGTWVDKINYTEFWLGLDIDDVYIAFRDTPGECYAYGGNWTIDDAGTLKLPLTGNSDPLISGFPALGDYQITGFDVDMGTICMKLDQLNNGDSLTSLAFGTYSPKLYKISRSVSYDNPAAPVSMYDYNEAIGQWAATEGEIEGWRYSMDEEHAELRLSILDNGTASFSYADEYYPGNDKLLTSMPISNYDEPAYFFYPEEGAEYGQWHMEFEADEENSFIAVLTSEYTMELIWFQGEWTDTSYPSVSWYNLERTY